MPKLPKIQFTCKEFKFFELIAKAKGTTPTEILEDYIKNYVDDNMDFVAQEFERLQSKEEINNATNNQQLQIHRNSAYINRTN